MKNLYLRIKWAYQRAVRGYDDTIMWDFGAYFEQFINPLEEFCKIKLKDKDYCENNPERARIYECTLGRIFYYRNTDEHDASTYLWKFVGENIGVYWD